MIILEKPYTSTEMADYLDHSQTPVLDNAEARAANRNRRFNLTEGEAFAAMVNAGGRLYTTSENALGWIAEHVENAALLHAVDCMKDKAKLRTALAPLYPGYYFRTAEAEELPLIAPESLPLPLVLKPSVGFFSVGVHVVASLDDWRNALDDIRRTRESWSREYPDSVVGGQRFILEQYITGEEYAVDAYYDAEGQAVVLNILKHDFASTSDVSDRLYYTSTAIIDDNLKRFTDYLNRVGALLGIRDFPLHAELRVGPQGIIPIEFNPLRFAGWCTTDLAWFAFGLRTYEYYLTDRRPDWGALSAGRENNLYSIVILDKPAGTPDGVRLDSRKLAADFTEVLHFREIAFPGSPVFGFLFARTPADGKAELERIMRSDLSEYVVRRAKS